MEEQKLSKGTANLVGGYIDYAMSVVVGRALPDVRDGLKPVQRKVLYTLFKDFKGNKYVKSATVTGATMQKYHPHDDGATYTALTPMTAKNGAFQFPFVDGYGNWSSVNQSKGAAAKRYTECRLLPEANELFGEMDGVSYMPNFDNTTTEPQFLPCSFPSLLVNGSDGVAVGFKCNIPQFNFNDVIDLTLEYLKNGKCTSIIYPDFTTGGFYIKNDLEMKNIMYRGRGKLKLRCRMDAHDKQISVIELPWGRTEEMIVKQVNKSNIGGIKDFGMVQDKEHEHLIYFDCASKNRVNEVVYGLLKDTDLQYSMDVNMTVVRDNKPMMLGVYGIIAEWYKAREVTVRKAYEKRLAQALENSRTLVAFKAVISDKSKLDQLVDTIYNKTNKDAYDFIYANYDNELLTPDIVNWIIRRRLVDFRDGGKYMTQYNEAMREINFYTESLKDVKKIIITQLNNLKATYGSRYPRRTEITEVDYTFENTADEGRGKAKIESSPCFYNVYDGFIKKLSGDPGDMPGNNINAMTDSTLVAIDNAGRVIRIYCDELPYTSANGIGVYIPQYCGIEYDDSYRIWWCGVLEDKKKMIIYNDGTVGFLDMSEWFDVSRRVKVLEKGISDAGCDKVVGVIDIPEWLFVVDSEGKIGYEMLSEIKQKDRRARTRVFNLSKGVTIASYCGCLSTVGTVMLRDITSYHNKLRYLEDNASFVGDGSKFIQSLC